MVRAIRLVLTREGLDQSMTLMATRRSKLPVGSSDPPGAVNHRSMQSSFDYGLQQLHEGRFLPRVTPTLKLFITTSPRGQDVVSEMQCIAH